MIWIFVMVVFFTLLAVELATSIQEMKHEKELQDIFLPLAQTEEEKREIKAKFSYLREMGKSAIVPIVISLVITGAFLVCLVFDFRDDSITKYRQGKIYSEDTERVTTRHGEVVKVDTVYTYHIVKNKKSE